MSTPLLYKSDISPDTVVQRIQRARDRWPPERSLRPWIWRVQLSLERTAACVDAAGQSVERSRRPRPHTARRGEATAVSPEGFLAAGRISVAGSVLCTSSVIWAPLLDVQRLSRDEVAVTWRREGDRSRLRGRRACARPRTAAAATLPVAPGWSRARSPFVLAAK